MVPSQEEAQGSLAQMKSFVQTHTLRTLDFSDSIPSPALVKRDIEQSEQLTSTSECTERR